MLEVIKMTQVSVIVPTYNAENTIEKAINSLLEQTFKDFEIIIVDDVSQDNTYDILKGLQHKDSRIHIFRNKVNSKSGFTRNQAIKKAGGEYIMQLDDDDFCDPYRMEKQVHFLDTHNRFDFVGSNVFAYAQNGVYGILKKPEIPGKRDLIKTSPFFNPSIMLRKKALEKVNGYRVSWETNRGQDYDMYLRMYSKGLKGYNIQEPLTYYYQDQNYVNKIGWKNRVGESKYRYRNFKSLGFLPQALPYVFKPIIAMIVPNSFLQKRYIKKINK